MRKIHIFKMWFLQRFHDNDKFDGGKVIDNIGMWRQYWSQSFERSITFQNLSSTFFPFSLRNSPLPHFSEGMEIREIAQAVTKKKKKAKTKTKENVKNSLLGFFQPLPTQLAQKMSAETRKSPTLKSKSRQIKSGIKCLPELSFFFLPKR